jgi:hypothetical protein
VAALEALEPGLCDISRVPKAGDGVLYLFLIIPLWLYANQVQVFIVEGIIDVAVLALLTAASLALSLSVFLILVDDETCTFLL